MSANGKQDRMIALLRGFVAAANTALCTGLPEGTETVLYESEVLYCSKGFISLGDWLSMAGARAPQELRTSLCIMHGPLAPREFASA